MSRRTRILTIGLATMVLLVLISGNAPMPLVALSPGPTFDTIGDIKGKPVVTVTGRPTYPTTGHLNMTTVSVTNQKMTAFNALRAWVDPDEQLVPRAAVYPPGQSDAQVNQMNSAMFTTSEANAQVAALRYLKEPTKVVVAGIEANAPAGGLLKAGDILINVNGQPATSAMQVTQLLKQTKPGDRVPVSYQRGDSPPGEGVVTVGARPPLRPGGPPDGPQGYLGIGTQDQPAVPGQIKIALADVGGPSAGLMFSLAVIDKITPADLTGGRFIAGTGTIDGQGNVGPIAGITLKMIGARRAGATEFLVPAGDCKEAKDAIPDGLTLIKVNTLDDAVNALNGLKAGHPAPGC